MKKKSAFFCVTAFALASYGSPYLAHRFGFNGNLNDSVGGIEPVAVGHSFVNSASGQAVKLSGGAKGSSYVNLGESAIPTDGGSATVEIWATLDKKSNYARIFETGFNNSNGYLTGMAWQYNKASSDYVFVNHGKGNVSNAKNMLSPYDIGVQYHLAMVFTPCDNGTWTVRVYKQDAATGRTLAKAVFTAPSNWTLSGQFQKYFYLGHTYASGDDDAAATYDELRIWTRALSEKELTESAKLGPDADIADGDFPFGVTAFDTSKTLRKSVSAVSAVDGIDKLGNGVLDVSGANSSSEGMTIYDGVVRQDGGALTVLNAPVVVGAYDEKSSGALAAVGDAVLAVHSISGSPSKTDGRRSLLMMDNATLRPISPDLSRFGAKLCHRWSFNGNSFDSVGSQTAGLTNCTYSADGKAVTLAGGAYGSSYVDLGSNILPKDAKAVTIEMWAKQNSAATWARIFEIGINKYYFASMCWNRAGSVGQDYVEIKHNNSSKTAMDKLKPYTLGVEYHIAITYFQDSDGKWKATAYKQDATTGETLAKTTFEAPEGWSLETMWQEYCYLGHAVVSGGQDAAADYNEVRVWRGALTEEELTESAEYGPDAPSVFVDGMTGIEIGGNGATVDTDGHDVTIASPVYSAGEAAKLVHRWSFNGDATDSIGSQTAVLKGIGAYYSDGKTITLPGGAYGASYIDLGSNIIPADAEAATIELWARSDAFSKYARIFEIGVNQYAYANICWFRDYADRDFVEVKHDNVSSNAIDKLKAFTVGTEYHIAVTYSKDSDGKWKVTAYKQDATTGETLAKTTFEAPEGWSLKTMWQEYCYLGHSIVSGSKDAAVTYNEVRVWRGALTEEELTHNAIMGPDVDFGTGDAPVFTKAGAGTLTLEGVEAAPSRVAVSGGVLNVASANVLPQNVQISIPFDGKGGHGLLSCSQGVLDVSGMSIEVSGIKESTSRIIMSKDGITGNFSDRSLPAGYSLVVSEYAVDVKYHALTIVIR